MTINVVATLPIDPARADEAAPALAELAASSAQEEGCLRYDVFASSVAGTFVTIEEWRSKDDLHAHMSQPHLAKAFEVVGPLLAGEVTIHMLDAV